jgi:hypothetical protein
MYSIPEFQNKIKCNAVKSLNCPQDIFDSLKKYFFKVKVTIN